MITLLTDYGHEGPYVGVCHGVIRGIVPSVTLIDVSHSIEPYDVLQGLLVLADAIPYLPIGVHVAVVDPEVGTERRALALACADGRYYVGPDNGLLMRAADRSGIEHAIELPVARASSATFAGRDVFAPAAAQLADSVPL
ncbi:MAG: SAM-dependent chlorinase/fluorinase, partial [Gaiellaceae bacterium]